MAGMESDVFKLFQWDNSLKSIKHLESLLQCSICKEIAQDAKCLGRCEHFFCAKCVNIIENGTCPKCKIPAPPCEMQPDRIITNLVASAKDLRLLLNGGEISGLERGIEAPLSACSPNLLQNLSKSDSKGFEKSKERKILNKSIAKTDKSASKKSNTVKVVKELGNSKTKSKEKALSSKTVETVGKPPSKISATPFTPEGKKIAKITNLSALGMSPGAPSINKRNSKGETALHISCIRGEVEKVKTLLEDGANPNSKDNAGWTPLHEACSHGFSNIAEMLLQHGAILDVPGGESDENPLHDAVSQGHLDIIKILRAWGASDTARNRLGHTPRSLASLCMGSQELLAALDTPVDSSIKKPPVMPPFLEKMVILGSGLSTLQAKNLDQFSKMLRARLVTDFCCDVSHIVIDCTPERFARHHTPEYFMGIASGKWIVSHQWMEDCLSQGLALNPEPYEVHGSRESVNGDAPTCARINASKLRPGLFSGCHIYLWGTFREPFRNKKVLETLVKAGSGVVLAREPNPESTEGMRTVPYHSQPDSFLGSCSHIILYQDGSNEPLIKYKMDHIKTLPISWFMECIQNFALVTPTGHT